MVRCRSSFLLALTLPFVILLAACVGKSSSNSDNATAVTIALSPGSNVSLDLGSTQTFTANARNAFGQSILTGIQFASSNNASLTIATNGLACAGTWDSLTNPTICTPGSAGVAEVTATVLGVSSSPTTVYVHQHIDNIAVTPMNLPIPNPCFSQGETWQYQATAFSNGVDITNSVGPFSWSATNGNVLTVDSNVTGLLNNQVQVTAKDPGITPIFASIVGVTSNPLPKPYTTCLVQSIMLQVQNEAGNTASVAAGSSKTIEATVLDTRGNLIKNPPLTWSTSNPEIASFATASNTTGSNAATAHQSAGSVAVSAACEPSTCNIGIAPALPVYASNGTLTNGQQGFGVISLNVTQSKTPTFTAWTATQGCGTNFNCTSFMFSVTSGSTPIAAAVNLPRTPNSLVVSPNPSVNFAYVGSDQGLMMVNMGASPSVTEVSGASSPCSVIACGKVLTVAPDGNHVVVADTVTVPNQVYIFDNSHASNLPIDVVIPGATAAAYSPDQLKLFILSNTGQLFVVSTIDALGAVPIATSATDVAFAADGSLAYVAGDPDASISEFSTCGQPGVPTVKLANGPTAAVPLRIFPTPNLQVSGPSNVQKVVALEPPNLEILQATFAQQPILDPNQLICNPPSAPAITSVGTFDLGQGNFTPLYVQAVGDGSHVIVVAKNVGAVLVVDLNGQTTTAIPLVNNAVPRSASSSPDGSQVFVAACDDLQPDGVTCSSGSVHIVNTQNGGDMQQVPFVNPNTNNSMCNGLDPNAPPCVPDLIAVRPQ